MSRYFFDIANGDGLTIDGEGQDFASRAAISMEIARILGDIAREEIPEMPEVVVDLTVRDESGKTVSRAKLTFTNEWVD